MSRSEPACSRWRRGLAASYRAGFPNSSAFPSRRRSVAALITKATGIEPYYVGKPNPLMMRSALNRIEAHSETTVMIGDRLDTDIVSGLEAGLRTILVLTGSTRAEKVDRYPFVPTRICESIEDVIPLIEEFAPAPDEQGA